ncbi:exosortase V [Qipengyuania sphaerica]|uniref:exosortase V n=1 Tax=Qipengyuania sphaerica TaxID=2867243 RepID=UPI001C88A14E|nr:exosortase V [Qipengyuania sphaerica]MBX7539400.1 exosortase V [Qipengyuania sphaerica]
MDLAHASRDRSWLVKMMGAKNAVDVTVLAIGILALTIPTMAFVVREGWTGETGAHAPIILATGLWLLYESFSEHRRHFVPPRAAYPIAILTLILPLYAIARVTQIVEIEGYLMYAALIAVLYSVIGWEGIRRLWFPLIYLLFIFPPPESVVAAITLPLKLWISQAAVGALSFVGYPIGAQGVTISVGQYLLLVAAACAGLNTILSLSAISLFYAYVRHKAEPRYVAFLALLVLPVALFANWVRVVILILLTYHFGEATGQGFMHNFAGLLMFAVALGTMFALDALLQSKRLRFRAQPTEERLSA